MIWWFPKLNELSKNIALNKTVVNYDYFEVAINLNGEVITYLAQPVRITFSEEKLRKPPVIYSKALSSTLITVMNAQKKWSVVKIDEITD